MTPRTLAFWMAARNQQHTRDIDNALFVGSVVARHSVGWSENAPFPLSLSALSEGHYADPVDDD